MALLSGLRITRTGILFIIGLIVLVGLVSGGIWFVRDRGEQARRQEAVKIAEQNLKTQSETKTETKTETQTEVDSGTTAAPAVTETATQAPSTAAPQASQSSELPQTGADPSQVIIVSILALALGYYLTSRRAVREL